MFIVAITKIYTAPQHKVIIMYLQGDDGFFDQYKWLDDYLRRVRDFLFKYKWLLELKQKLQLQLAVLSIMADIAIINCL